jgi:hypothetical protein
MLRMLLFIRQQFCLNTDNFLWLPLLGSLWKGPWLPVYFDLIRKTSSDICIALLVPPRNGKLRGKPITLMLALVMAIGVASADEAKPANPNGAATGTIADVLAKGAANLTLLLGVEIGGLDVPALHGYAKVQGSGTAVMHR